MKARLAAAALATAAGLGGCGGDTIVVPEASTITQGREFTDLQRALEAGAIDQKEYDRVKKAILKRRQ